MKKSLHLLRKKKKKSSWILSYDNFKPAREGLREALCTLGNGYFATRGAANESTDSRIHYPGTYIAGVYNKLTTHIAGQTVLNEDLVNCPNWLFLMFRIGNGEWITPSTTKILSYHQKLDIRQAILVRKIRLQDRRGRISTLEAQRIVHMAVPHLAAIKYVITPENYEADVVIRSSLDGRVQNTNVARYRQLRTKHLRLSSAGSFSKNGIYLSMKTSHSHIDISQAARVRIFTLLDSTKTSAGRKELKPVSKILTRRKKGICQEFVISVHKKKRYEIEKIVAIYTSKDKDIRNPLTAAISSVKSSPMFDSLFKTHKKAWDILWRNFDINVEGDTFSQKVLRLHTFHFLQTASIHNTVIDAGVPARGLHGEAYRGHVFWDELFVMPFYDLHAPEISKALFLYRYRRLPQARKYAIENGYRGAMFPWQSGATGEEETQVIHLNPLSGRWGSDFSRFQRHVSFAIAYNVWQYWKRTADLNFLASYGAEMILSIAQFGASLAKYSPKDERYHTEGLMGPDEFHEKLPHASKPGFEDNAYTNLLIVWTILKARQVLTILPEHPKVRLLEKLGLTQKELKSWEYITQKMNIVISDDGIIGQFDGYFKLKELDWKAYKAKYGNIQRMDRILKAEGKSPNEYKVTKQADVLMLFYLFPLSEIKYLLTMLGYKSYKNILKKNYEYYIKRTSHGSSLSKVVHCYVANLLGKSEESWQYFLEVLKSDLFDTQGGTTPEGIHLGVMGGSLNIAMSCFAGINILEDRIKVDPKLPKSWRGIKLRFCYRKTWVSLSITRHEIMLLIHGTKSTKIPFEIYGKLHYLSSGKTHKIPVKKRWEVS